ncbi:dTDP-4-dehydrorhamnose reductase [Liquorilactobacillus capillatus]|uniref:dTDP-4-dehydrorhamnose reductase n=1 Tax=Liquorilactobacillus capillatus DSM 19910 TaxID=1423731 RepID=A0A0R1M293_9LACO|nr:dTDP-4-dehydrorhamnose reductase [Liquorilactobacillus capillatus]KRL02135.1 dTDP-4-dehydrorhamnose reductase [Liquorilactobacillus capillatus DSM 19910]
MSILITGAKGQLGQELTNLLTECGQSFCAYGSHDLDITDEAAVEARFASNKPDIVYHCAAYTAVDKAENEGKERNYAVNVAGTKIIAKACQKYHAKLIYISTDYVFDGEKAGEYLPSDPTNPQNEYGRTKLLGEQVVQKYCNKYYIVRTSWVFGKYGHNFVYTMLKLAQTHDNLTVVNDQIGRPTWTRTLAEFITYLVDDKVNYGIYHCCNDGYCSWYEFACEILKDTDVKVKPVTSAEYPTVAYRPKRSVLKLSKETGFSSFVNWKTALASFMVDKL